MNTFVQYTADNAPEKARHYLQSDAAQFGFLPALYVNLTEVPAPLEVYFGLSTQFDKASLTSAKRQVVPGVTIKTFSSYANNLTGTKTNPELSAYGWKKQV